MIQIVRNLFHGPHGPSFGEVPGSSPYFLWHLLGFLERSLMMSKDLIAIFPKHQALGAKKSLLAAGGLAEKGYRSSR